MAIERWSPASPARKRTAVQLGGVRNVSSGSGVQRFRSSIDTSGFLTTLVHGMFHLRARQSENAPNRILLRCNAPVMHLTFAAMNPSLAIDLRDVGLRRGRR